MTTTRRLATCSLSAVALAPMLLLAATAQEAARKDEAAADDQMVDGVITWVALEKSAEGKSSGVVHLKLNTAAVWRDYARDTATEEGTSATKAAEKGEQSVATKGQPADENTIVDIELPADTYVDLRYRSQMDESSLGAPTPEEARTLARRDPQAGERSKSGSEPVARRGKKLELDRLKDGLWLKVAYRKDGDRNVARHAFVLEPVRDTTTTANPRDK